MPWVGYRFTNGRETSYPFFPLLPFLLRLGRLAHLPESLTGVVVGHAGLLGALVGVRRLARRHVSEQAARRAMWAAAFFPGAVVFSEPYPEALLLCVSVWAFVLVEDRRDVPAGLLGAAATLLRPNGFLVAVALAVEARTARRAAVVLGPSAGVLGVWTLVLSRWTHDPFVFVHAKRAWREVTITNVVTGHHLDPQVLGHLLLAVAALLSVVRVRWQLPVSWLAFTVLWLTPSLGFGIVGMGRYASACFSSLSPSGR